MHSDKALTTQIYIFLNTQQSRILINETGQQVNKKRNNEEKLQNHSTFFTAQKVQVVKIKANIKYQC